MYVFNCHSFTFFCFQYFSIWYVRANHGTTVPPQSNQRSDCVNSNGRPFLLDSKCQFL